MYSINPKDNPETISDPFKGLDPSELPKDLVKFILETEAVIVDWEDLTSTDSEIIH